MNEAIFVDIDNTLVITRPWDTSRACLQACNSKGMISSPSTETLQNEICGPLDRVCMIDGGLFISRVRPGAKVFLEWLRTLTPNVYALSAERRPFQVVVMREHGLLDLVNEVYGREALGERDLKHVVPVHAGSLLIDDQEHLSMLAIAKLNVMRMIRNDSMEAILDAFADHFVHVLPFEGDEADMGLTEAMPAIQDKFGEIDC
jgi:hypothetical protein